METVNLTGALLLTSVFSDIQNVTNLGLENPGHLGAGAWGFLSFFVFLAFMQSTCLAILRTATN
jgi:hypothetical protein